jgi:hypothetical protein
MGSLLGASHPSCTAHAPEKKWEEACKEAMWIVPSVHTPRLWSVQKLFGPSEIRRLRYKEAVLPKKKVPFCKYPFPTFSTSTLFSTCSGKWRHLFRTVFVVCNHPLSFHLRETEPMECVITPKNDLNSRESYNIKLWNIYLQ